MCTVDKHWYILIAVAWAFLIAFEMCSCHFQLVISLLLKLVKPHHFFTVIELQPQYILGWTTTADSFVLKSGVLNSYMEAI